MANPLVLPILGLLVEQPRHAYAVFAELRRRYTFLTVRNATVYTLLSTLTTTGWVDTTDSAARPTLTTSPVGREAFAEMVNNQLRTADPADTTAFMTALAYIGILTPAEAAEALRDRLALISRERHRIHELVIESGVTELHMIEAYFYLNRLGHDAAWVEQTIHRIETGDLTWPGET
ncbi:MAG: helix-turn-helix transcriptional regulator [Nocardioidaceae bacterium]